MKLSVDSDLVVEGVQMNALRISQLIQALGPDRTEEKIPLYGGGTRRRETCGDTGVTTLRDEEEEAICLIVDASGFEVSVGGRDIPMTEREFLRSFAAAEKQIGHSYSLRVKQWLLYFDFPRNRKGRGVGSSVRQLSRVTISQKKGQPAGTDNDRAAPGRCLTSIIGQTMRRTIIMLFCFATTVVPSLARIELYDGFAADQALLRKQALITSGGKSIHTSSGEACEAAYRIFTRVSFLHRKKTEVVTLLGDPKTISDYGIPKKEGKDSPLIYRFDSGFGGWEYRLSFRNDVVSAVEAIGLD